MSQNLNMTGVTAKLIPSWNFVQESPLIQEAVKLAVRDSTAMAMTT